MIFKSSRIVHSLIFYYANSEKTISQWLKSWILNNEYEKYVKYHSGDVTNVVDYIFLKENLDCHYEFQSPFKKVEIHW